MSEVEKSENKEEAPKSQALLDYEEGKELLEKNEISQAANAFHNALIGYQQDKDENGIANASDRLGDICLEKENFDQALSHWETTYKICDKASDRVSTFSIIKKRAKLYRQWKKYDQAITFYLDMFDEYSANNNPHGTVNTLETLSEIYLETGDKANAIDCLKTAANIHKNFSHKNFHDRIMERVAELEG